MSVTVQVSETHRDGGLRSGKDVLRTFAESAVTGHKLHLLPELFHPEVTVGGFYPGVILQGLDAFRRVVASWCEAFPDRRFEMEDAVEEGDRLIARLRFSGTHRGDVLFPRGYRIPATGREVEMVEFYSCRFAGGLISEVRALKDQLRLFQQLGLVAPTTEFLAGMEE
jgi:predicted ester cyclase